VFLCYYVFAVLMNNNYVFKALLPRIRVAQVNNAVDAADEGTLGKFEAFDENTNGIKRLDLHKVLRTPTST